MSFYMQEGGWKHLAGIIAGAGNRVDGMYAEYSVGPLSAGERSHGWYGDMPEGTGYIRLHMANAYVDDNATIHFTAYITSAEIPQDLPDGACIRCATLVELSDVSATSDKIICTVDMTSPVRLDSSEYIVIHAGLRLGESR